MDSEYVLHVVMKLKPDRLQEFQQHTRKLLPVYLERFHWQLLAASHTEDDSKGCEVLHVWLMPELFKDAFGKVKAFINENPDYKTLDELIKDCCESHAPKEMKLAPYQPRLDPST